MAKPKVLPMVSENGIFLRLWKRKKKREKTHQQTKLNKSTKKIEENINIIQQRKKEKPDQIKIYTKIYKISF